jgi:hypothetical protein
MLTSRRFVPVALAFAMALLGTVLPAFGQSVPNWNVTLPANPDRGVQKVTLVAGRLTATVTYSENTFHFSLPLKTVASITPPYLYTSKAWLIDLKLRVKTVTVNAITPINKVDKTPTDQVSIQFLTQADAAAGRAYLLAHM